MIVNERLEIEFDETSSPLSWNIPRNPYKPRHGRGVGSSYHSYNTGVRWMMIS